MSTVAAAQRSAMHASTSAPCPAPRTRSARQSPALHVHSLVGAPGSHGRAPQQQPQPLAGSRRCASLVARASREQQQHQQQQLQQGVTAADLPESREQCVAQAAEALRAQLAPKPAKKDKKAKVRDACACV